jgi:hypothetical protein
MTQNERLIQHITDYGSVSPLEARHVYGIERLAARIDELRKLGIDIVTHLKKDANGKRYAEYTFA